MRSLSWTLLVSGLLSLAVYAQIDVNVANVPDCAKVCLSNSTQYATDCAQIDVKCLCNSPSYVSALSCCLATNCNAADQQTAIQFNIQECTAVNSTAPNFVGCSPFSLTTGSAGKGSTATESTSSSGDAGATTITGGDVTIPTAYTNTRIVTAAYAGSALLTGTCSVPMFAQITGSAGSIIQFPQVGCASNRGNCCPFDPNQYAGLTKCPADYITTAGGCCPSGYSVYSSNVWAETPCFSKPTRAYLPASAVSGSQITLITDTVFSRKYDLVGSNSSNLSEGAIAGVVIGASACAVGIPALIVFLLRRHRSKQEAPSTPIDTSNLAFPSTDPAMASQHQMSEIHTSGTLRPPQELASPETRVGAPATIKGLPFHSPSASSGLPAYEKSADTTKSIPAEMPGSTHMYEHHPAYAGPRSETTTRTPPRSPPGTAGTGSPIISPATPHRGDSPNLSIITPLGSPSLRGSPRFREEAM